MPRPFARFPLHTPFRGVRGMPGPLTGGRAGGWGLM